MGVEQFVEDIFPIECKGRDSKKKEVLDKPVKVRVRIYKQIGSNTISSQVECLYNTGGHGQRCKASHQGVDKVASGVNCPYSFDIPYAFDKKG